MSNLQLLIALLAPAILVYPIPSLRAGADRMAWNCCTVSLKVSAGAGAIAGLGMPILFPFIFVGFFVASAIATVLVGVFYLVPLLLALHNRGRLSFPTAFLIGVAPGLVAQFRFDGIEPFAFSAIFEGPIIAGLCVARVRQQSAPLMPESAPPEGSSAPGA